MMCLLDELKGHPKPRAAVAVLLEKGGLLGRSRGGAAGVAFVARRAAGSRPCAGPARPDRQYCLELRGTFDNLRERLMPAPRSERRLRSGPNGAEPGALPVPSSAEPFTGTVGYADSSRHAERRLIDLSRALRRAPAGGGGGSHAGAHESQRREPTKHASSTALVFFLALTLGFLGQVSGIHGGGGMDIRGQVS